MSTEPTGLLDARDAESVLLDPKKKSENTRAVRARRETNPRHVYDDRYAAGEERGGAGIPNSP
mgnify:CR=1 FL=1